MFFSNKKITDGYIYIEEIIINILFKIINYKTQKIQLIITEKISALTYNIILKINEKHG